MGLRTCTELVSWRKLYGIYLTVEAELHDTYLAFHTGKVYVKYLEAQ